jgi:hypothetical protein
MLGAANGALRADLQPVFAALHRQPPRTVLAWLRDRGPRVLLAALAHGKGPVALFVSLGARCR